MQPSVVSLLNYAVEPCQQVTPILKALCPLSMTVASLGPDKCLWIASTAGLMLHIQWWVAKMPAPNGCTGHHLRQFLLICLPSS